MLEKPILLIYNDYIYIYHVNKHIAAVMFVYNIMILHPIFISIPFNATQIPGPRNRKINVLDPSLGFGRPVAQGKLTWKPQMGEIMGYA
jgi:hypothetical protein